MRNTRDFGSAYRRKRAEKPPLSPLLFPSQLRSGKHAWPSLEKSWEFNHPKEFLLAWELPLHWVLPAQTLMTSKEHQTGWDLLTLIRCPPAWQEIPSFHSSASTKTDARVCGLEGWKMHQYRLVDSCSSPNNAALKMPITALHEGKALYSFMLLLSQWLKLLVGLVFLIEWNKRVVSTFILKLWSLNLLENYLWDLWISYLHRSSHLYLLLYIWP